MKKDYTSPLERLEGGEIRITVRLDLEPDFDDLDTQMSIPLASFSKTVSAWDITTNQLAAAFQGLYKETDKELMRALIGAFKDSVQARLEAEKAKALKMRELAEDNETFGMPETVDLSVEEGDG